MIWIILIIALVLVIWLACKVKIPKCGNMTLTTGGIKTGKSAMTVRLAYKTYKKNLNKVKFWNFLQKFRKKEKRQYKELPCFYSNIPLRCNYVPLTEELLTRKERFSYGSVCYVCECSLVACSMDFKDDDLNENLLLLNKLFAHETKGGSIFYDTQSISDNHYAVKRCLATYFYIHHNIKIPYIALVCFVREMKFSDDNSAMNNFNDDVENELKMVIIPWSTFKLYDRYCYSALTDDLPINAKEVNGKKHTTLKANRIVTFKKNKKYYEVRKNEKV